MNQSDDAWGVHWEADALKEARRLDRVTRTRIVEAIDRFAATNYGDVRTLVNLDAEFRLRVGSWRILFNKDYDIHTLIILHVLPRGSAYD